MEDRVYPQEAPFEYWPEWPSVRKEPCRPIAPQSPPPPRRAFFPEPLMSTSQPASRPADPAPASSAITILLAEFQARFAAETGGTSEERVLPFCRPDRNEAKASLTADGLRLYSLADAQIAWAERVAGDWVERGPLPAAINTPGTTNSATFISPSGDTL